MTEKSFQQPLMSREVYDKWLLSLPEELCTFCEWQHYQIVLASTQHWLWILNRSPYWKYHTMLIPRRHVVEMSDLSVVETGELFTIYGIAVEALRQFQVNLPESERTGKYIFFWRFRSDSSVEVSDQRKVSHFHLHLTPDRERMFDPLLDKDAHEVDYIPLLNIAKRLPSQIEAMYNET